MDDSVPRGNANQKGRIFWKDVHLGIGEYGNRRGQSRATTITITIFLLHCCMLTVTRTHLRFEALRVSIGLLGVSSYMPILFFAFTISTPPSLEVTIPPLTTSGKRIKDEIKSLQLLI